MKIANPELNDAKLTDQNPLVRSADVWSLILWIAIVFTASAIGSLATSSGLREWYGTLNKPSFQPPNWLFGPVWTCLYLMMAVAAWLVWRQRKTAREIGASRFFLIAFAIQLVLNVLWSVIFFGLRSPAWALIEIGILWTAITVTIYFAYRCNPWAGHLLVPYLAWTSFAMILNFAIWQLN